VIPCWTEGVQKMKVGGKAKFVCPSSLAYGDMGRPGVIPPGATLVFDVELLEARRGPRRREDGASHDARAGRCAAGAVRARAPPAPPAPVPSPARSRSRRSAVPRAVSRPR
jgi:FKBP-type peptidyl-prolyl cis-trans isomerase FkpA